MSAAPKPARKTAPDVAAQFMARGYVLTEGAEFALRDLAAGLEAIAALCEEREGDMPEIPGGDWGGLLRTFSRAANQIGSGAAFLCGAAPARPRDWEPLEGREFTR